MNPDYAMSKLTELIKYSVNYSSNKKHKELQLRKSGKKSTISVSCKTKENLDNIWKETIQTACI